MSDSTPITQEETSPHEISFELTKIGVEEVEKFILKNKKSSQTYIIILKATNIEEVTSSSRDILQLLAGLNIKILKYQQCIDSETTLNKFAEVLSANTELNSVLIHLENITTQQMSLVSEAFADRVESINLHLPKDLTGSMFQIVLILFNALKLRNLSVKHSVPLSTTEEMLLNLLREGEVGKRRASINVEITADY